MSIAWIDNNPDVPFTLLSMAHSYSPPVIQTKHSGEGLRGVLWHVCLLCLLGIVCQLCLLGIVCQPTGVDMAAPAAVQWQHDRRVGVRGGLNGPVRFHKGRRLGRHILSHDAAAHKHDDSGTLVSPPPGSVDVRKVGGLRMNGQKNITQDGQHSDQHYQHYQHYHYHYRDFDHERMRMVKLQRRLRHLHFRRRQARAETDKAAADKAQRS